MRPLSERQVVNGLIVLVVILWALTLTYAAKAAPLEFTPPACAEVMAIAISENKADGYQAVGREETPAGTLFLWAKGEVFARGLLMAKGSKTKVPEGSVFKRVGYCTEGGEVWTVLTAALGLEPT